MAYCYVHRVTQRKNQQHIASFVHCTLQIAEVGSAVNLSLFKDQKHFGGLLLTTFKGRRLESQIARDCADMAH